MPATAGHRIRSPAASASWFLQYLPTLGNAAISLCLPVSTRRHRPCVTSPIHQATSSFNWVPSLLLQCPPFVVHCGSSKKILPIRHCCCSRGHCLLSCPLPWPVISTEYCYWYTDYLKSHCAKGDTENKTINRKGKKASRLLLHSCVRSFSGILNPDLLICLLCYRDLGGTLFSVIYLWPSASL